MTRHGHSETVVYEWVGKVCNVPIVLIKSAMAIFCLLGILDAGPDLAD